MAIFAMAVMKSMSAKDAKNSFGLLLDRARAEPVTIEKHGRAVAVVMSVEEFDRISRRGERKKNSPPSAGLELRK